MTLSRRKMTPISERDDPHLGERQQNPERNQEELTSNLLSELSERGESENLQGTGDQDQDEDDLPVLEVWPESHWPGFTLRQSDVFQSYAAQ